MLLLDIANIGETGGVGWGGETRVVGLGGCGMGWEGEAHVVGLGGCGVGWGRVG